MHHDLTPEGLRIVEDVARRNGVSLDAAVALLRALAAGNGMQAQFNHPDLGGMGQWSQGGMIMIGDMFNQGLKFRVDTLCNELAGLLRGQPLFIASTVNSQSQSQGGGGVSLFVPAPGSSGAWWPAELGAPVSAGAQNDLRYAWFAAPRRLAIQRGGEVSVYDTGDHLISGFSQQQGGDQSLTFTSQFGVVRVADLPLVFPRTDRSSDICAPFVPAAPPAPEPPPSAIFSDPSPVMPSASAAAPSRPASAAARGSTDDIFAAIERLADLRQKGILTDEEFSAKKAELLSRI